MHHAPILAVHCGAIRVSYGVFSGGLGRLVLEHLATAPMGTGESNEDDWPVAVGRTLRELIQNGAMCGSCVVGLPGHLTFNREFHVPAVAARQCRKIVAFEERQSMPTGGEPMVWSHALLGSDENGRSMMLAVARRRVVEQLGVEIRKAGLFPVAVLPAWMVLRHAISSRAEPAYPVLALSIGARSSRLVGAGIHGFSARTFAVGGNTITQRVAEELQIDHAAAETLKLQGFAGPAGRPARERERAAGLRATEQFVRRLSAELLRTPPLLAATADATRPEVLWLTGGGARLQALPALLTERLGLRVELWDLRSQLGCGRAGAGIGLQPDESSLADLVGLAAYAARGARSEGNLLPHGFRREMFVRRRWPLLAAASLLVLAVGMTSIWRIQSRTREIRRQTAEMEAAVAMLQRLETVNRSNQARLAQSTRWIAALRKLAGARSGWTAFLNDMQQRLASVQDVWLDGLQVVAADVPQLSGAQAIAPARLPGKLTDGLSGQSKTAAGRRMLIVGHLLDVDRLAGRTGDEACPRAGLLLAALRAAPFIAAVEREHFVGDQAGLWRFEITLRLAPNALF